MRYRTLASFGLLIASASCVGQHNVDRVDSEVVVDLRLDGLETSPGPSLHIASDGSATRTTADGTQTTVIAPDILADLQSKIELARFPDLAPSYVCVGLCPQYWVPLRHMTVTIDDQPFEVTMDPIWARFAPESTPAALVAAVDAAEDILAHADWH